MRGQLVGCAWLMSVRRMLREELGDLGASGSPNPGTALTGS